MNFVSGEIRNNSFNGTFITVMVPFVLRGNISNLSSKWKQGFNRNCKYYLSYIGMMFDDKNNKNPICKTYLLESDIKDELGFNQFINKEDNNSYSIAGVKVQIPDNGIQTIIFNNDIAFLLIELDLPCIKSSEDIYNITNYFKYGQFKNKDNRMQDIMKKLYTKNDRMYADFALAKHREYSPYEFTFFISGKVESCNLIQYEQEISKILFAKDVFITNCDECTYMPFENVCFCYSDIGLGCFYYDYCINDYYTSTFNYYLKTNYLTAYIYALHQKYSLIKYLKEFMSYKGYNDIQGILNLKSIISDFKQEHSYNIISSVNELQQIYEIIQEKLKLNMLLGDIDDVLQRIEDIASKKNNSRIETFTIVFTIFSLSSILLDSATILKYVVNSGKILWLIYGSIIIVATILLVAFKDYIYHIIICLVREIKGYGKQ